MRTLLAALAGAILASLAVVGAAAARPAPKVEATSPAPPAAVEYKYFVPAAGAAFTSEHERELNDLGAQGWRVVAPIYAGGMLNSYLMMREKR